MRRFAALSLLALVLAACTQTQPPMPTGRIVVKPGYALLTSPGDSIELSAVVLDGNGNTTEDEVTWHSDADVISVDDAGKVTAAGSLGSGYVVARAKGLESAPVLIVVAQTVPGAVLVSDDQVAGEIEPVDPEAEYDLGWQYQVTLTGVDALQAGDLVVGTGELPVGGRVIASTKQPESKQLVTLEIVTLDALFVALKVSESLDLSQVEAVINDEIQEAYAVRELADGAMEFVAIRAPQPTLTTTEVTGTTALGSFECTTDTTFNVELAAAPSFTLNPSFSFDIDYDLSEGGLKKLAASGSVDAAFKFEPTITAAFEGSLKCEVELFVIPIPIGGPLAFIIGGQVPVGTGFELKGKLALAQLGLQTSATGKASLEMGLTCPTSGGDCTNYATGDASLEAQVTPKFPAIDEQFRVEAEFSAYAFADVAIGTRWSKRLRVQALRFTASAKQKLDLATTYAQAANPAYASTFDLSLLAQAKIGKDIEKVIKLLKLKVNALSFDLVNEPLAQSPRGTFIITPTSVTPGSDDELGQLATFHIQLDPVTYLGIDSVEKIEILWKKEGGAGDFTLENGRPNCVDITAGSGQTTFECQTDFLPEHEGEQTFYAFVHAKLFGMSLPVPLEVAIDGKATVNVGEGTVDPNLCEKILGEESIRLDEYGDGVASAPSYRKVSAQSNNGGAKTETHDFIAVVPEDRTLVGQDGYLRVRFRYHLESNGPSETSPAARVGLYPRAKSGSYYTFELRAGAEPLSVTETIERDVYITFAVETPSYLTSSSLNIRADTFRSGGGLVKAEAELLGIVSVLDKNKDPVAVDIICTASGTDYR